MSFYSIFAILLKDLIDVIKSKAVWVTLASPVILSLFFTMAYSSPQSLTKIGICDSGKSGFSDFLKKTGVFTLNEVNSKEEGRMKLDKGKWAVLLVLPPHFDENLAGKERPQVSLVINDSSFKQSDMILSGLCEVFRLYAHQAFPVVLKIERVNGSRLDPRQEMLPVWILLTIMGSLVVTTSSLMEEKEKKTLNALLVSPASIYDVIIGKGLLGVILTFASSILLLLLNRGLVGNLIFLSSILLAGGMCFSIWGILVALISPSQTTANSINSLLFIFLMIPVLLAENSKILWEISRFLPSFYLVDGIRKSMEGNCSFYDLSLHYIVLGGFFVALFGVCLRVISRQES